MTILEPILVDLIPFALLKLLIENDYYTLFHNSNQTTRKKP
ncbi:hypothetical protein HPNQ4099_0185 [Helicobacter pylori NQ4099]|uniref:Uncharacterized protein n=1 Tax=Helicobacter pylori NQ4099 TaxID=992026 RepID=I9QF86_HELPX|nr:hypothetical protein HPNQ4099_0185 [Helicobacter pylori NQ4099]